LGTSSLEYIGYVKPKIHWVRQAYNALGMSSLDYIGYVKSRMHWVRQA